MSARLTLLIDGYNLLFQSGLVGRGRGPGWLERARQRMLRRLALGLGPQLSEQTRVVFDTSQPAQREPSQGTAEGPQVEFAHDYPEADDLLEHIIRQHSSPKSLNVVSSDLRIRRCARARKATSLDAESFWQQLEDGRWQPPDRSVETMAATDDELLPADEVDYWLKRFDAS